MNIDTSVMAGDMDIDALGVDNSKNSEDQSLDNEKDGLDVWDFNTVIDENQHSHVGNVETQTMSQSESKFRSDDHISELPRSESFESQVGVDGLQVSDGDVSDAPNIKQESQKDPSLENTPFQDKNVTEKLSDVNDTPVIGQKDTAPISEVSSEMDYQKDSDDDEDKLESKQIKVEEDIEPIDEVAAKFQQTHTIIIPSYASWFDMNKIHQIEKSSVPEFFKLNHPSKSPKIYVGYRNFMINAYRLNPNEYLTLTSCRRNLVGDVGSIMRVYKFVNKWGLINYQVNPTFKPNFNLERLPNGNLAPLPNSGEFKVNYDTPRGLFPFETFKLNPDLNIEKLKQLMKSSNSSNGMNESDTYQVKEEKKRKVEDVAVNVKKFKDDWTSAETNSLLENIKKYKNDWFKISQAIGSKTPQECILKFLNLPIEDQYNDVSSKDFNLLKYSSNFPVNLIDNPVISNLIFMTQMVDQDVAKAASESASRVIEEKYLKLEDPGASTQGSTDAKDGPSTAFGIIGAKSYLFSKYEEREMFKIANTLVNQELTKINLKLEKINKLENIYETERKNLIRQQEEVFIDRLNLTNLTINILGKLKGIIKQIESMESTQNLSSQLDEIKSLLYKPTTSTLLQNEVKPEKEIEIESAEFKPVSIQSPQTFKVWVP